VSVAIEQPGHAGLGRSHDGTRQRTDPSGVERDAGGRAGAGDATTENDLERRIEDLEALVEEHARVLAERDRSGRGVSGRSVLQTLGVVGLGGYAAGTASADPQAS